MTTIKNNPKGASLVIPVDAEVIQIARAIEQAGGRSFLVGGFVRDFLLGRDSKDIDIEVFKIEPDKLVEVLSQFGKVDSVGVSFGVIKLTTASNDFDFSLPRTEVSTGDGHQDFKVVVDPFLTVKDAARRRDFTFNAMMVEITTWRFLDFFGGLDDMQKGIIHHVSAQFAEDPLRVLRAMQFAARFGWKLSQETIELCKSLVGQFETISKERVWTEFEKMFLKGRHLGMGFNVLSDTGWDVHFPSLTLDRVQGMWSPALLLDDDAESRMVNDKQKLAIMLGRIAWFSAGNDVIDDHVLFEMCAPMKLAKQARELRQIADDIWLSELEIKAATRTAIGLQKKHCDLVMIRKFLPTMLQNFELDRFIGSLTDWDITPRITGQDLLARGWDPKVHGREFGKELKRLFKLQLRTNAPRPVLLRQID